MAPKSFLADSAHSPQGCPAGATACSPGPGYLVPRMSALWGALHLSCTSGDGFGDSLSPRMSLLPPVHHWYSQNRSCRWLRPSPPTKCLILKEEQPGGPGVHGDQLIAHTPTLSHGSVPKSPGTKILTGRLFLLIPQVEAIEEVHRFTLEVTSKRERMPHLNSLHGSTLLQFGPRPCPTPQTPA